MIDLLAACVARDPESVAVVSQSGRYTYRELFDRANRQAVALSGAGIARFGTVEPDAAAVITLLAAAALVGAQPCQYQPDLPVEQVDALRTRLDHNVVIGEGTAADLTVAELETRAGSAALSVSPVPDPGLLILTTGTTGDPRAARHTWSRLARTIRGVRPAPDQRWLLAYGPQQFAGVQVLLHVLAVGATLVAPFPRQPRDGARALVEHDITHVSATPTYWRFLIAELRARGITERKGLMQLTLGGEAAPDDLLADLREFFPGARLSHIYAGTEFGSTRSVRDGRAGLPLSVLTDADDVDADVAMKIVDGELWIRSRVGMQGYYGDPEPEPDAWRASGDLVEVVGDRIVFRGRKQEIVNVGGVKVSPLPIESRINALPGVQACTVYGRANRLVGNVVAVDVVLHPGATTERADDAIRAACADLAPAARPRSIRFVDALTTRGGKLIRRQAE